MGVKPADPLLQNLTIFLPEGHPQYLSIGRSIDLLQPLVARGAFRVWDESRDHQNLGHDFQSLLRNSLMHLFLQSSHLVQDVHNLQMHRNTEHAKHANAQKYRCTELPNTQFYSGSRYQLGVTGSRRQATGADSLLLFFLCIVASYQHMHVVPDQHEEN